MLRADNPSLSQVDARRQCLRILLGVKKQGVRFTETNEAIRTDTLQLESRKEFGKLVTSRL